jgi:uncharacterized protein YjbI with pentapeptide repeats
MKKPSNKSNKQKQKISTVSHPIECKHEGCGELALSLSKYCWEHMLDGEKSKYKQKIEDWHKKGKSLKDFILIEADLSSANLFGANLSGAELVGVNLSRAGLVVANLSGAGLWGTDLSGAELFGANLSGADLEEANLSGAILSNANLSDASFRYANLSRAMLNEANLSGARLCEANLSKVYLWDADLSKANLEEANLSGAKLRGANLSGAILSNANLSVAELYGDNFRDAILTWADLTNAKGLRINCFTEKLSDKEKKNPSIYQESYLFVKNYFIRMGLYDDASEAAYREKVLQRLSYFKEFRKKIKTKYREFKKQHHFLKKFSKLAKFIIISPFLSINYLSKRIGSLIWSALCGYAEKPLRPVVSALVIIIGYGLFYWYANVLEPAQDLLGSMYFSIVTFTTLGYGDIKPIEYDNVFRFICSSEAFIGAFMIALFVWTLARRGAAR